jgi:putative two-component system response regulator
VAVILAIDDSLTDLTMIQYILSSHQVLVASDGKEGLRMLTEHPETDLILLDLRMPVMDGFAFLDKMGPLGVDIPIIILTNSEEVDKEILGLDKGAMDFIRKPLNFQALQKHIEVQLRLKQATEQIRQHNRMLEEQVQQRTAEIRKTNEITINALVRLLEVRNIESSNHSRRTKVMMEMLCRELQQHPAKGYQLSNKEIQELVDTAPLHDIGKVGIPDNILLKPGKLDQNELVIMREHVLKGVEALDYSMETSDTKITFIETARELIASHHEWFDGSGYPKGLAYEQIPLSGRLMAVIDVYDALTSKRVYKDTMSHEEALKVMRSEAERHFDPIIFQAFLRIADSVHAELKKD